jgi:hypothetical protein
MSQKHLSPEEFDKFMTERNRKRLEKIPKDKSGFIIGNYIDVYFKDNMVVECSKCGIPLYVRPESVAMSKERNLPFLCLYCAPWSIVKGQVVQDIAAVLQHKGEK